MSALENLSAIYLDNQSSTPVDRRVRVAISRAMCLQGNPSSSEHVCGGAIRTKIESARSVIAKYLNRNTVDILFTAGATESNFLSVVGRANKIGGSHEIVTSNIEHPSIYSACAHLQSRGWSIKIARADSRGIIDPDEVSGLISKDTRIISIIHSNNEIGSIQDLKSIESICPPEAYLHADASQSLAFCDLSKFPRWAIALSGHKAYGPKGVSTLALPNNSIAPPIAPIIPDGTQERGLRPGTECAPLIVGMGKTVEIISRERGIICKSVDEMKLRLWLNLCNSIDGITLNGPSISELCRLPCNINVRISGVSNQAVLFKLKNRVCISTGSACSSGKSSPSKVLKAIGLTDDEVFESFRIGIGRFNTTQELELAAGMLKAAIRDIRG